MPSHSDDSNSVPQPDQVIDAFQQSCEREYVSPEYVNFRIDLLKAQVNVYDRLVQDLSSAPPSPPGDSPIHPDDFPFDREVLNDLFQEVISVMRNRAGGTSGPTVDYLTAIANEYDDAIDCLTRHCAFLRRTADLNELAEQFNVPVDPLMFIGRILAAPFVTVAVDRLIEYRSSLDTEFDVTPTTSEGTCPYCASPASLSILRQSDGRRLLCCGLCGQRWFFHRVQCPFCEAQQTIEMLTVTEKPVHWIDRCTGCNTYLKTIDERTFSESTSAIALVEATATLYLDLIADDQGAIGPLPYCALR